MKNELKTIAKRIQLFLGMAPAALLLIALAGNTAPMCGDIDPLEPICDAAADCTGLPHIECAGGWSCNEGQCNWICDDVPPPLPECQEDMDCGPDQFCLITDCIAPDCDDDGPCALTCMPVGECVDKEEPPLQCSSDEDCAPDEQCEITDCIPLPCDEEICPPCCEPVGQCVPKEIPGECQVDSDCPVGHTCQTQTICYDDCMPGPDGEYMDCMGTCEDYNICVPNTPPPECLSDEDCGPGFVCMLLDCLQPVCPDGEECPMVDCAPYGVCVAETEPLFCMDDSECPAGFICEFDGTYCYGNEPASPEGDPGAPFYCGGVCVPGPQPECFSDFDCKPGMVCIDGFCQDETEPLFCMDDSECPGGFFCDFDENTYCGEPMPGNDSDEWDAFYCAGVCVPYPACPEIPCPDGTEMNPETCLCEPVANPCVVTGCSGEICSAAPVASACVWQPFYECFAPAITTCGPFGPGGSCMWQPTAEFHSCLQQFFP